MDANTCPHTAFAATATVEHRPARGGSQYRLRVEVKCHECGLPFQFVSRPPKWRTITDDQLALLWPIAPTP